LLHSDSQLAWAEVLPLPAAATSKPPGSSEGTLQGALYLPESLVHCMRDVRCLGADGQGPGACKARLDKAAFVQFAGFHIIDVAEMEFDSRKPNREPSQHMAYFLINEMLQCFVDFDRTVTVYTDIHFSSGGTFDLKISFAA
jgi:hypothetical protein